MMKISSKGHHPASVSPSDSKSKKSIVSKQNFELTEMRPFEPKHIEVLNRIRERVKVEGGHEMSEISRVVIEEMLKEFLRPNLNENQFQKMVDRVSMTVQDDPVLSNFIKKIITKIS